MKINAQTLRNILSRLPFNGSQLSAWDVFLLYISLNSFVAVVSLALHLFYPLVSVLVSLLLTVTLLAVFKVKIRLKETAFDKHLFFILLVALAFRLPPYLYLMGGQDQGTYVNISKQYEISHSLYAVDHYRETLTKEEQKLYDEHGNYLMPSIQKWNRPDSEYSMVFYPLHPAWMSIFGQLFGSDNRVYSLTMFSLISLVSVYLLAYELSGKRKSASYIATLFLALNPLHVFFSKFPVGEVVALAFTSSSFYYLAKYYNDSKEGKVRPIYLILSALLLNGFFYTRMSSYIYLPFFYLLTAGALLFCQKGKVKIQLLVYLAGIFGLFLASFQYYFMFLRPLFELIYNAVVLRRSKRYLSFFGGSQEQNLQTLVIILLSLLPIAHTLSRLTKPVQTLHKALRILPVLHMLIIVYLGYFTYNLLMTTGFPISEVAVRHAVKGLGFLTLKHLSLVVIIEYTGILVFVAFVIYHLYVLTRKISNTVPLTVITIFVSFYLLVDVVALPTTRYPYYNARYYLSEAVPYLLLVVAVFLSFVWNKKYTGYFAKATLILTLGYFGYFSVTQFYGTEMPQLKFYDELNATISKDDLILAVIQSPQSKYDNNFIMYVLGPLKYYYNYHLFVFTDLEMLANKAILNQIGKHRATFVLTNQKLPESHGYSLEKTIRLNYNHYNVFPGCTNHTYEFLPTESIRQLPVPEPLKCFTPPNSYYVRYKDFYLYRLLTVSTTKATASLFISG